MMKLSRISIVSLVLFVSVISALPALAAMGGIDRFAFSDATDKDMAGAGTTIGADGKPDAEFTVSIRGTAGAISGFTLKNLTTGEEWATSGGQNVLVAVNSRGAVVNGSFPMVAFLLMEDFRLYANDREAIMATGGEFEIAVRFADNSTATARTTIEAVAPAADQEPETPGSRRDRDRGGSAPATPAAPGSAKVITSSFLGKGNFDLTNETKRLSPNINPDYRIDVSLAGSDTLTGVRVRSTGGAAERIWDTVPTTTNPLIAVTEQGRGTPLNSADGSISIPIRDLRDLSFWFDGNDEVARQDFRVTLLYTGGRVEEIDIKQAAPTPPAETARPPQRSSRRSVQMLAKPVEIQLDVVGKDRLKRVSGLKDFSLVINVSGQGTLKAISVANQTGNRGRWDTIPGSSAWLTIVRTAQVSQPRQLNDPTDFSISIPVNGNDNKFELLMENDGTLANNQGRLLVSVTWDDGEVVEEFFSW